MKYKLSLPLWLFVILSLSILPMFFVHLAAFNVLAVLMSLVTIVFMATPFLLEKYFRVKFPQSFLIILLLFLFASIFLGTANRFYDYFWWWDKMLHGFSGFVFAYMGYLLHMYLDPDFRLRLPSGRIFAALFAFSFSLAAGGVWEIYEYTIDSFFGTQYQGVGIHDTMRDIILDTLGALVFSCLLLSKDPFPIIQMQYVKNKVKVIDKGTEKRDP